MPYDERLVDRMRALLEGEAGVTEQRMFGGLAFLIHGNMAVAASRQGGALVRVDPEASDKLTARGAEAMVMRGRVMTGWLHVDAEHLRTARQLATWVGRGRDYACTLPPKR